MAPRSSSAVALVALLAALAATLAAPAAAAPMDGRSVSDVFAQATEALRAAAREDAAFWRTRFAAARQEAHTRLDDLRERAAAARAPAALGAGAAGADAAARRRMLTTPAEKLDAARDLLGRGWQLIMDAGGALKGVVDLKADKVRDLLSAVLGEGSAAHLPAAWLRDNFSWDLLGDFSLETSLDTLLEPEALSSLLDRPADLVDLTHKLDLTRDAFCETLGFEEPLPKPTKCAGAQVVLELKPKACEIDPAAKVIACVPARLVLRKVPGECTLKRITPASWTGKECKVTIKAGLKKEVLAGADPYTVDLGALKTLPTFGGWLGHHADAAEAAPAEPAAPARR